VTDKNGKFHILPLNNFTFRPLQHHASYVDFTIFKPGYGAFGGINTYKEVLVNGARAPNSYLDPNKHVLIELPKLKTREEIRRNIPSPEYDIPFKKQKKFLEKINIELNNLQRNERIINKRNRPYRIKVKE